MERARILRPSVKAFPRFCSYSMKLWLIQKSTSSSLETLLKAVVKAAAKAPAQSSMPASGTATPRSVSGANSGASALASSTALAAAASSAQVDIASPQLQYTLVLALWILTYEPEVASSLNTYVVSAFGV